MTAWLPRLLLYSEHVGDQLGISKDLARRWLADGRLGKTLKVGRRRAITVWQFRKTLRRWENDQRDGEEVQE